MPLFFSTEASMQDNNLVKTTIMRFRCSVWFLVIFVSPKRRPQFGWTKTRHVHRSSQWLNAGPQQDDLRLSGPLTGQGASGEAQASDRRVPVDIRVDSLATVPLGPSRERGDAVHL
ncbi:hypothetical protein PoB_004801600 [Plakobranchus ocellatus]|uniref:Uncharacterized protein n=1 Tax=Plakobranchus ocellatus TaxID=259542 RepID=A0AAV4BR29_9GAST|nr:hypothetical protein PoB_004801600 [Plakobranchus ocellatus]